MSETRDDGILRFDEMRRQRIHPEVARIDAYWESLRRGRLVPTRGDIDPRGLSGVLEHAFIVERIAPGLARFRVAGAEFARLMGMDVRGMPISAAFTPDGRLKLSEAVEAVFSEPACVTLDCYSNTGVGRPPMAARLSLLPLRSDGGEVTRALGALSLDGDIGRTPRRLDVAAIDHRTLTGYAEAPADRPPRPVSGFAEPAAPFDGRPSRAARTSERPYLRLVKSD